MPLTTIELRRGTSIDFRRQVSDAVHTAMTEVLGIPDDDRFHVFHELAEGSMIHEPVSFGIPRGEDLLFVTFSFSPRPTEQKHALYEAVVRQLGEQAGVGPERVLIRVIETSNENWWGAGRVVDPGTGYDERMSVGSDGVPINR